MRAGFTEQGSQSSGVKDIETRAGSGKPVFCFPEVAPETEGRLRLADVFVCIKDPRQAARVYRSGSGKSDRGLSGGSVLLPPTMAEKKRPNEPTSTQEPFSGFQGEGGPGRSQG